MKLETEKAEAEKRYWLMISCIEFAENIKENLQISTNNPVILGDAQFWIRTQIDMIRASWWPRRHQHIPGIFSLKRIHSVHLEKSIGVFICCCQELVRFSELYKQKVYRIQLSTASSIS